MIFTLTLKGFGTNIPALERSIRQGGFKSVATFPPKECPAIKKGFMPISAKNTSKIFA